MEKELNAKVLHKNTDVLRKHGNKLLKRNPKRVNKKLPEYFRISIQHNLTMVSDVANLLQKTVFHERGEPFKKDLLVFHLA